MTNDTPIKERIRALLAKAGDKATTEAEAASTAALAAKLLLRHGLTEGDVTLPDQSEILVRVYDPKYTDPWRRSIVFSVAELYMCEALNTTRTQRNKKTGQLRQVRSFAFVGRPTHTELCTSMTDWLIDTVVRLSREYSSVRRDQLAFQRGCGEGLASRIYQKAVHQTQTPDRAAGEPHQELTGTQLAILSEQIAVRDWMKDNIETTTIRVGGSNLDSDAASDGLRKSSEIGLDDQISSADVQERRLLQ